MGSVRKVLSSLSLVAICGLVVVGVVALLSLVGDRPAASALVLAAVVVGAVVLGVLTRPFVPRIKKGTILELDLKEAPVEGGSANKLAALNPSKSKSLNLADTIETMQRAANDKRIAGLILRPRFDLAPRSVIDELREAIVAFGESGKFTIAISDSYGEGGPANGAYNLATACQTVTVQETGMVGLSPLSVEANFYPDVLARLGIDIEVFGRGKYKSAPNRFTMKKFTPADREQTERLLESFWDQATGQIAQSRKLSPKLVKSLAEKGPLLASEALEEGLVDRIVYVDQAIEEAKASVGKKATLLYLHLYKKRAGKARTKGKAVGVAVIRAAGEIRREAGMPIGLGGPTSIVAPDTLVPHIRAAVKDKSVKAIVLRIDSPGGSALASDTIWRELVRARESGKPIVASMASVAASGGYYIAAPADKIVASRATVTGSIGVFGMRPLIADAKKKLKIHTDEIHVGEEPPGWSLNRKLTPKQRERVDVTIDATYDTFLKRVADGRKMTVEAVFEVAQGRVWTGADAVDAGLVDELGGLDHALSVAVELTGAAKGTKAKVKPFPKKASGLSSLRPTSKGDNSEDAAASVGLRLDTTALTGRSGVQAHLGLDPRTFWTR
ncbi:MAG: signal peptide peptidase SppA [Acidimicrobiales bacterium]|nr:signal peptide peptidase SppA [Acidimicrobiales bacterium]